MVLSARLSSQRQKPKNEGHEVEYHLLTIHLCNLLYLALKRSPCGLKGRDSGAP